MMNKKLKQTLSTNEMIVVYIIVGLCILIGVVNPAFAGVSTVITLSRAMLVTLIFAICEMIVIISGGIDVSFPAVACMAMYATVRFTMVTGIDNPLIAYLMAGAIGVLFGVINAILIAKIKLPPLIATLGVSSAVNGATLAFLGTEECSISGNLGDLSKVFYFFLYQCGRYHVPAYGPDSDSGRADRCRLFPLKIYDARAWDLCHRR